MSGSVRNPLLNFSYGCCASSLVAHVVIRVGRAPALRATLLHVARGAAVIARAAHFVTTGATAVALILVVLGLAHAFALLAAVVVPALHTAIVAIVAAVIPLVIPLVIALAIALISLITLITLVTAILFVLAVIALHAVIAALCVTVAALLVVLLPVFVRRSLHGRRTGKQQACGQNAQRQRFQHILHTHNFLLGVGISPIASLRQHKAGRKMADMLLFRLSKFR